MKVITKITGRCVQVAGVDVSGIQEETSAFGFQFVGNVHAILPLLIQAIDELVAMCEDHEGYLQKRSITVNGAGAPYLTISKLDYAHLSLSLNNCRILVQGTSYKFKAISRALKKALKELEQNLEESGE
jgi:hypothetical protein